MRSMVPSARDVGLVVAVIAIVGMLGAAVVFLVAPFTGWVLLALVVAALAFGAAWVPLGLTFGLEVMRIMRLHGAFSRIFLQLAQTASINGSALVERAGRVYELRRIQLDGDPPAQILDDLEDMDALGDVDEPVPYVELSDGIRQYIAAPIDAMDRLGGKPFATIVEQAESVWGEYVAETPPEGKRLKADGGEIELLPDRKSVHELLVYNPWPRWRGMLLDASKVQRVLAGAGGPALLFAGKRRALMDHGGGGQLTTKWLAITAMLLGLPCLFAGLLIAGVI